MQMEFVATSVQSPKNGARHPTSQRPRKNMAAAAYEHRKRAFFPAQLQTKNAQATQVQKVFLVGVCQNLDFSTLTSTQSFDFLLFLNLFPRIPGNRTPTVTKLPSCTNTGKSHPATPQSLDSQLAFVIYIF